MSDKIQVLSLGGGRQSTLCVVLAGLGVLPKPDYIVIADTGYEINTTWQYLNEHTIPFCKAYGLPDVTIASAEKYASYGLYDKHGTTILPMYTKKGMMRKFCSATWKRDVIKRCVAEMSGRPQTHQVTWLGLGLEEKRRWAKKASDPNVFLPLVALEIRESDYSYWFNRVGLPMPTKSACYFCPFRTDFSRLTEQEIAQASAIEQEINEAHELVGLGRCYFHRSRKPFADAVNEPNPVTHDTCDDGCFT